MYVLNNAELYIYEQLNHINKLYAKNYLISILFYNKVNNTKISDNNNKLKHVVSMNNMIEYMIDMNDDNNIIINKKKTLKQVSSLDDMKEYIKKE